MQKKSSVLKAPKHGGVYVVAHRGAHFEQNIPENSIPAYQKAIDLGVDFVEIDVRITKDGHFVSVHNEEIDKYVLEDNPGLVADMTLAELKQLDIGSRKGSEWKNTRIPTFEEILDLCKGKSGIYLDLKQAPVKPLIEMIKARGMVSDVIWYADDDELEEVKKFCPECIIMPDPGPEKNLPELINRFHPDVIAAVWKYVSESFVKTSHDAGAIVIVDGKGPNTWEQALEWSMDGIQTDQPTALVEFLKKRNMKD
jgi:glycerophosphoryl diester phosphodiesterase